MGLARQRDPGLVSVESGERPGAYPRRRDRGALQGHFGLQLRTSGTRLAALRVGNPQGRGSCIWDAHLG